MTDCCHQVSFLKKILNFISATQYTKGLHHTNSNPPLADPCFESISAQTSMCKYHLGLDQDCCSATLNKSPWVKSVFKSALHWGVHGISWQTQWSASEPRLQPPGQPNAHINTHTHRHNSRWGSASKNPWYNQKFWNNLGLCRYFFI